MNNTNQYNKSIGELSDLVYGIVTKHNSREILIIYGKKAQEGINNLEEISNAIHNYLSSGNVPVDNVGSLRMTANKADRYRKGIINRKKSGEDLTKEIEETLNEANKILEDKYSFRIDVNYENKRGNLTGIYEARLANEVGGRKVIMKIKETISQKKLLRWGKGYEGIIINKYEGDIEKKIKFRYHSKKDLIERFSKEIVDLLSSYVVTAK